MMAPLPSSDVRSLRLTMCLCRTQPRSTRASSQRSRPRFVVVDPSIACRQLSRPRIRDEPVGGEHSARPDSHLPNPPSGDLCDDPGTSTGAHPRTPRAPQPTEADRAADFTTHKPPREDGVRWTGGPAKNWGGFPGGAFPTRPAIRARDCARGRLASGTPAVHSPSGAPHVRIPSLGPFAELRQLRASREVLHRAPARIDGLSRLRARESTRFRTGSSTMASCPSRTSRSLAHEHGRDSHQRRVFAPLPWSRACL